jgi:hypothetical protein
MSDLRSITQQLKDRLIFEMLTPNQMAARIWLENMDFPPHRVINLYGPKGSGKTFLSYLLQREGYATAFDYGAAYKPVLPRLLIDKAPSDTEATRALRPLAQTLSVKQIILLSRNKVQEPSLPAFEMIINDEDREKVISNLYRHLKLVVEDGHYSNYFEILKNAR